MIAFQNPERLAYGDDEQTDQVAGKTEIISQLPRDADDGITSMTYGLETNSATSRVWLLSGSRALLNIDYSLALHALKSYSIAASRKRLLKQLP